MENKKAQCLWAPCNLRRRQDLNLGMTVLQVLAVPVPSPHSLFRQLQLRVTCLGLLSADKFLIRLPVCQSIDISNKLKTFYSVLSWNANSIGPFMVTD